MRSTLVAMTVLAVALGGCNRSPDQDHPRSDYTTSLLSRMSAADIDRVTTPPAPPERGPIPPDANAAAPGTNASLAYPEGSAPKSVVPPAGSDHSPEGVHVAVMAQDAAAKAPDTAAADEAKRKVYEEAAAKAEAAPEAAANSAESAAKPMGQQAVNPSGNEPATPQASNPSTGEPITPQASNPSAPTTPQASNPSASEPRAAQQSSGANKPEST